MSDESRQTGRGASKCVQNRELVAAVVAKLRDIASTSTAQAEARQAGDETLAAALNETLGRLQAEKDRSIEAWHKHVREHGC
jgi:hypothetical protein